MIYDLSKKNEIENVPIYDLCVVGSGPAGLSLVKELSNTGLKILVIESGSLSKTPKNDSLREVISKGIKIKDSSRERVFGGASITWAGLSSPFDNDDFLHKKYIDFSGWPISYLEIEKYYEIASSKYAFPRYDYFNKSSDFIKDKDDELDYIFKDSEFSKKTFLANSEPQRFAKINRGIFDYLNIDLYLNATVSRLLTDDIDTVVSVEICLPENKKINVRANYFVIAAGGIDNAKIILNSKHKDFQIGNEHDQVGRFLMNHPKGYYGKIILNKSIKSNSNYFGFMKEGVSGYTGVKFSDLYRRENNLLNSYIRFEPEFVWSDCDGVVALNELIRRSKSIMRIIVNVSKKSTIYLRSYAETGDDAFDHLSKNPSVFISFKTILVNISSVSKYVFYRLMPFLNPGIKKIKIRNFLEMDPEPKNRIYISKVNFDKFGMGVPVVEHYLSDKSKESIRELHNKINLKLKDKNMGSIVYDKSLEESIIEDASHYMGSTKMGLCSKDSVVDNNCKVHGIKNLFVAGSSVFATSGCVNPTYTIVALSIKLADFLKEEIKEKNNKIILNIKSEYDLGISFIGAGKRFSNDILKVVDSIPSLNIKDIYTNNKNTFFSSKGKIVSKSINLISKESFKNIDLLYISIPYKEYFNLLNKLKDFNLSTLKVIIDTPVVDKRIIELKKYFKDIVVAEDMIFVPWIDFFEQFNLGKIKKIIFNRSVYSFHGIALIKKLLFKKYKKKLIFGFNFLKNYYIFINSSFVKIVEPRDYEHGSFYIETTDYKFSSHDTNFLRFYITRLNDNVYLKLGEYKILLSEEEKYLLDVQNFLSDNVVLDTHGMKRIGLRRLMVNVVEGKSVPSLSDSYGDYEFDKNLRKFHVALDFI